MKERNRAILPITAVICVMILIAVIAGTRDIRKGAKHGIQANVQPTGTLTPSVAAMATPSVTAMPTATPPSATPEPTLQTDIDETENALRYEYTDDEIEMLAKMVYGEAQGCAPEEQALVVWTALNRVDDGYWGDTISKVLSYPGAFAGYGESFPIEPKIYEVCRQAVIDWAHFGTAPIYEPYATTANYKFFDGDGKHNWFREKWR